MRASDNVAAMADAISRFQAQVQRLALDIVQAVMRQELERVTAPLARSGKLEPARSGKPKPKAKPVRPAKRKPARPTVPQLELQLAKAAERQLDLELPQRGKAQAAQPPRQLDLTPPAPPAPPAPAAASAPPAPAAPRTEPASSSPTGGSPAPAAASAAAGVRKRTQWTRETIVHELASWMSKGTAIDAQFMTRHGPRGLVAATRRIFGRFDAALNLAALHVSKMQPEGPQTPELS